MNQEKITKEADLQAHINDGWRLVKNNAINPRLSRDSFHVEKDGKTITVHAACAKRALANDMVREDWREHTSGTGILTHIHYRGPNQESNRPVASTADRIKTLKMKRGQTFDALVKAKTDTDAKTYAQNLLNIQVALIKLGGVE